MKRLLEPARIGSRPYSRGFLATLSAGAALLVGLAACSEPGPSGDLRIATGGPGGVYFDYGHGMADAVRAHLPDLSPEVLETAASLDNIRMVVGGDAEVAFSLADSVSLAVNGDDPFGEPQPVRALARLYDNYVHFVVAAESDIWSLDDLRGHPVSTGAAGSGTEVIVDRLLEVAAMDPASDIMRHRLNIDESAVALAAGEISAFFFSAGLPTAAISELADAERIRLIDLSEQVPQMRERFGELYSERSIPRSMYGLETTTTIGVPNYLVVREDMDESLAYELTALLFNARDELARAHQEARRLNLRAAFSTYPVELHAGAIRYYRAARSG
ncbi:TAXI family TRAP transporter solute-binding subunit [Phytoactinopolyspora mesophila]|uniref:TAXI family TRAP transporter solute-binding subunit n=1 Tax=Phytoactinopolyspora mesophila TaxID=2650750 RepID=A0A7K3MAF4_9ACTN|nr:TAXI family TRAP transporter solute-binding subunit [Phytoactinopolyspora mesophila]NDL59952.1 TAXI family TRAP transporter solute-binding subunit [Phytoactinopolyspora mesophila]